MALISCVQFIVYLNPDGTTGPPPNATLPITLTLSDGSTVAVADQKVTALALMESMRLRRQWMLQLSDDVFAVSIGATKLMFCEDSLTLQRWHPSRSPAAVGATVPDHAVHRWQRGPGGGARSSVGLQLA